MFGGTSRNWNSGACSPQGCCGKVKSKEAECELWDDRLRIIQLRRSVSTTGARNNVRKSKLFLREVFLMSLRASR